MKTLARWVRGVDRLNDVIGRGVSWLSLVVVLIVFAVVILRYGFSLGWIWLQELYLWLHAVLFMTAAGYTLRHDGHVRVDIFYRPAGERYKAFVDLFGALFLLLPLMGLLWWVCTPYVTASWSRWETSREIGGLGGFFVLKSVLLVFTALVSLQGMSMIGRSILVLRDTAEFTHRDNKSTP